MSFTKAVFLKILYGVPVSLSFFTIVIDWSASSTTPVAAMRNDAFDVDENASMPVFGGVMGPQKVARQCMCSGVYLRNLQRRDGSRMPYTGTV